MKLNNDFRYDLMVGNVYEKRLGEILENKKIEVKTDFRAHKTGKVFVEFEYKGRMSGVYSTESDLYAFLVPFNDEVVSIIIVPTNRLIQAIRPYIDDGQITLAGDGYQSKGVILPVEELIKCSKY